MSASSWTVRHLFILFHSCFVLLLEINWESKINPVAFAIVPVNLKEQDAFHLTIEEYLLALCSLIEELV